MDVTLETRVVKLVIEMDANEGRELYAQLYRLAADGRPPGRLDGMLSDICIELGRVGLDS